MMKQSVLCLVVMMAACNSGDEASDASVRRPTFVQSRLCLSLSDSCPLEVAMKEGKRMLCELKSERVSVPATGFVCVFVATRLLNRDGSCRRHDAMEGIRREVEKISAS